MIVIFLQEHKLAIEFLEKLKEKVKHEQDSRILCDTTIGAIYLEHKQFDLAKVGSHLNGFCFDPLDSPKIFD
jgi:hypothetical protein